MAANFDIFDSVKFKASPENDGLVNFNLKEIAPTIIKVIGVGGGGSNAVEYMYSQGICDVDFVICNTDAQALHDSPIPTKIQLGTTLTEGHGAGNNPKIGAESAEESMAEIADVLLNNTKMVFITAAMGGGTGTGAAPVIAKMAKEHDILTVGIVSIPARFEGPKRLEHTKDGLQQMKDYVDCLIIIDNEKIKSIYGNKEVSKAFAKANDILKTAAKGIAEIITLPGYINVDFADVRTVMKNSGVAIMGAAQASGKGRATRVITEAIDSPLLNNNDIRGAKNILLNITSGTDELTMNEITEITSVIIQRAGDTAEVIWGVGTDEKLGDAVSVTIIATGFPKDSIFILPLNSDSGDHTLRVEDVVLKPGLNRDEVKKITDVPAYERRDIRVIV